MEILASKKAPPSIRMGPQTEDGMSTGLFPVRRTEAGRRPRQRRATPGLDAFAEQLAETGDVATAAARIGVSLLYGRAMLQRIRKQLGWQAQ